MEKLEGQAATIAEEHAQTRAELAGLEERHRGERSAMGRLEQQFRETTNRRNAIAPEISRLGEQRARLLADNIELDQKAAELAGQITALDTQVNEMATQDAAMREALRAGEEELKGLRAAAQETQERRSQIEIDLVRKQAELKYLDETSRKELGCAVEELAPGDEAVPDADAITEAEQAANEVRARIESLGAVNAAAMEEYQEAQQRHDLPERAAPGPDRFDPRYGEGDSGDRPGLPPEIRRGLRGDQRTSASDSRRYLAAARAKCG